MYVSGKRGIHTRILFFLVNRSLLTEFSMDWWKNRQNNEHPTNYLSSMYR